MGLRHHGLDGPTFQMREKIFAIGDDFWIEDDSGQKVFKVDNKKLRIRDTFILEDMAGNEVELITQFEDPDGNVTRGSTKRLRVPKYSS